MICARLLTTSFNNGCARLSEANMSLVDPKLTTTELLKLAADHHQKKVELTEEERRLLIAMLKERGQDELDYGQEMEVNSVRLVKRVNGAVGVYFS